MYDLKIEKGLVVTPTGGINADILVKDGKIQAIGADFSSIEADKTIDAEGLVVLPGMIDSHAHISEPGRTEWEGYETGTASAAKGGVTTLVEMPLNQLPCTANSEALALKIEAAEKSAKVHSSSLGALTPTNLDDLQDLADDGVVGYKAFMSTAGDRSLPDDMENVDDYSLWEGMRRIEKTGKPLMIHCENASITDSLGQLYAEEGPDTLANYVASRPVFTEVEAVKRAIFFAEETGCKIGICHCSCPEAVQAIHEARARGVDVIAESCPHYFYFTTDDLDEIGNTSKCSPPIRDQENQDKMWELLFEGKIEFLGSDHSPCTPDLKEGGAFEAWGGISGMQNAYDSMFDEAVNKRDMPLEDFAAVMSKNAADYFELEGKGALQVGYDADIVLLDPNESYTVKREDLEYKNKISAYVGAEVGCKIKTTILMGEVIYDGEKVTEEAPGQIILNK